MLKSIADKLIKKQSNYNPYTLFERLCIIRFGSEEKAKEEVLKLSKNGVLDEQGFTKLTELLYLDKFIHIFEPITETSGLVNLIKSVSEIQSRAKTTLKNLSEDEIKILKKYADNVPDEKELFNFLFPAKNKILQKKLATCVIEKQLSTSKDKIAHELGIDKTTLNKWLNYFYGKKFNDVRKISFKDYCDIIHTLTLRGNEDKSFIGNNLEEYVLRLDTDLVHNRGSLLKIDGMDDMYYKSLKENLQLKNLDSSMKKIPFSIKDQIVTELS